MRLAIIPAARLLPRSALILLIGLALLPLLAVPPAQAAEDLDAEQQFIALINADRREAGLGELVPASDVRDVAVAWSNVMADEQRMYHNPDYSRQYCCWRRAAENVGWTTVSNMTDPVAVRAAVERLHQAFMDSPGHRANLLQPDHDHIGLGIELRADSCPDGYGSRSCMWVTENFRDWDGTQPAGGLQHPYASGVRRPGGTEVAVSDTVHPGGFDGDVTTVERLGAASDSAVAVSRARFDLDGARHAVLARDDAFPDSLAGSPLSADGPLLFTSSASLDGLVRGELQRVLPAGATVYLLGGTQALAPAVDQAVRDAGLRPVRLEGRDRVETALRIADEVRRLHGDNGTVVLARGWGTGTDPNGTAGWVDSVTGGAWATNRGVPVIVSASDTLSPQVARWLAADAPSRTVLLGQDSALSEAVRRAVPHGLRVGGTDRAATAAAVSTTLWGITARSPDRHFVLLDGWSSQGWRDGLAAAGLSADADAPVLVVHDAGTSQPSATRNLVGACGAKAVDLLMAGPVRNHVAAELEALDGGPC